MMMGILHHFSSTTSHQLLGAGRTRRRSSSFCRGAWHSMRLMRCDSISAAPEGLISGHGASDWKAPSLGFKSAGRVVCTGFKYCSGRLLGSWRSMTTALFPSLKLSPIWSVSRRLACVDSALFKLPC